MQTQNNVKDYGCVFSEYDGKLRPIFYIKSELWTKILELNGKEKHKVFDCLSDEKEETFILNINDMGLPVLPITKTILCEMLDNSYDVENLDRQILVEKYNLTEDYINNSVDFLNNELKKISYDLMRHEIKKTLDFSKDSDNSNECSDTE
jgi:hypothetical protein